MKVSYFGPVNVGTEQHEDLTKAFTGDAPDEVVAFYKKILTTEKGKNTMKLDYTIDVMDIMTELRRQWNMKYPEEK